MEGEELKAPPRPPPIDKLWLQRQFKEIEHIQSAIIQQQNDLNELIEVSNVQLKKNSDALVALNMSSSAIMVKIKELELVVGGGTADIIPSLEAQILKAAGLAKLIDVKVPDETL